MAGIQNLNHDGAPAGSLQRRHPASRDQGRAVGRRKLQFEILAEALAGFEGAPDQVMEIGKSRVEVGYGPSDDLALALAEQQLGRGIDQQDPRLYVDDDDRGRQVLENGVGI